MTLWDFSDRLHIPVREIYPGAQGVIFVVDAAADPAQLAEAEGLLEIMMQDEAIRGLPLLLLANKSDLLPPDDRHTSATAANKLVAAVPALDRHSVESRTCSAIDGMYSVSQGLTWLTTQMQMNAIDGGAQSRAIDARGGY